MDTAYHLGKKSKYFGRENELVSLWQDNNMTIDAISKLTKVSKRTLHKLFDPMGYDSKALAKIHGQQLSDNSFSKESQKIIEDVKSNPTFWREAWSNRQLSNTVLTYGKEHGVGRRVVLRLVQELYPELADRVPTMNEQAVASLTHTDIQSFSRAFNKHQWLRNQFPKITNTSTLLTELYSKYPETRSSSDAKRISTMNDESIEVNALRLLNDGQTIFATAKKLNVSHKVIRVIAERNGIDATNAIKKSYRLRRSKISSSLKNSNLAIKQRHNNRHFRAVLTADYISRVPDWLWHFIDSQPPVLFIDKIYYVFQHKHILLDMLNLAKTINDGVPISWTQLTVYLPKIKGIHAWNKLACSLYANDKDINNAINSQSSYELRLNDFLKSLDINYRVHDRSFGFELDFLIPDKNLAIEVSPITTHHSNKYKQFGMKTALPKTKNYHNHKFKVAEEHGIKLITLFEKQLDPDIWLAKTIPMLKRLLLGHAERTFYARQTHVVLMKTTTDKKLARNFLDEYHMDGASRAQYYLGMFLNETNELVGVASFTPYTKNNQTTDDYELKRLAFASDVQIRFGVSKFVKTFGRLCGRSGTALITFSNNNMGNGSGYRNAGFVKVGESVAQLTFINPYNVNDTYSWQVATPWSAKSGVIADLLGSQQITTSEARRLVETELPHRNDRRTGYVAQYDAGNYKWIYYFK